MTDPTPTAALFRADGTPAVPDRPALLGGRCGQCGHVCYPMQIYGCEHCGSTDLSPVALSGRGWLVASAVVHVHASPARQAPFTVGSILTVDGAFVRALIAPGQDDRLVPGTAMVTELVDVIRDGQTARDLRFTVER